MTDPLTRRIADNQITMAREELVREARRLAEAARVYADDVPAAAGHGDEARRLTHYAANLLLLAARLDGMRQIEPLVAEGE